MHMLKYRVTEPGLAPRRTKLQVPGWSGQPEPRADGSQEYAWHCVPFSECAKYGVEVFYPYERELRVTTKDGRLVFDADFQPDAIDGRMTPPVRTFGDLYYTYQLLLDFKPEPGFAMKIEPHPRFYTDATYTTPIAVPALIRAWWPMWYFIVFMAPPEGKTHVFRKDEPFAQFTMIPEECEFELVPMSEEEAAEREMQSRRIYDSRETLSKDSKWTSATDTIFDATYRRIYGAVKEESTK